MLDIETLGNNVCSPIVQIGACFFDRKTGKIGKTFQENIDINFYINNNNFRIDSSTLYWWFENKNAITWNAKTIELSDALEQFNFFIGNDIYTTKIWCHAAFDIPILSNAYYSLNYEMPWHFTKVRDLRTLEDLSKIPNWEIMKMKKNKDHSGLGDCKVQVNYSKILFEKIKT